MAHFQGHEWLTQRNVDDPADESGSGIDFDSESDDVDTDSFLKAIENDDQCDETGAHLNRCGLHLCKAKLAHMSGDHAQVGRSINAAMSSFSRFHSALKTATEG